MADRGSYLIAQFSDIHCGDPRFDGELLKNVIDMVNRAKPDLVVVPGDLTAFGYRDQFEEAREYIECLECGNVIVIPGNHDGRNVGSVHFEALFGERWNRAELDFGMDAPEGTQQRIRIVAADSTRPDLDDGEIGRYRYDWLEERLVGDGLFKVVTFHHHLVSVPGTGRERNILLDAGDVLEMLGRSGTHLVLAGHKHVPWSWQIGEMVVVTSGTASTWRTRGNTPPSFNLITIDPEALRVDTIESATDEKHTQVFRRHPAPTAAS
jgi:Icc protein